MAVIKKRRKYDVAVERQSDAAYFLSMWRGNKKLVEIPPPRETHITVPAKLREEQKSVKEHFRALAEKLCKEHPAICVNENMLGGVPHIKGVRLTVGNILAKLYVCGSLEAVLDSYAPHVSEEQIKEAIAYAQDFLEMACDPHETS